MIDKEQSQSVSDQSVALQSGRDINIGLSYPDIKIIVFDLFEANFPKLVEMAKDTAEERVKHLGINLEEKIKAEIDSIDMNSFKEPDCQATLKNAAVAAGLKGEEKVDFDLLTDFIILRATRNQKDLIKLLSEEAVDLISKILPKHLSFLSYIHYVTKVHHSSAKMVAELQSPAALVKLFTAAAFDVSDSEQRYLEYLGLIRVNYVEMRDPIGILWNCYKDNLDVENQIEFTKSLEKDASSLFEMIAIYRDRDYGHVSLTTLGEFIGITNLRKVFGTIDYSIWIK